MLLSKNNTNFDMFVNERCEYEQNCFLHYCLGPTLSFIKLHVFHIHIKVNHCYIY